MTGITAIATMRLRTETLELSDLKVKMRGIESGMARIVLALPADLCWRFNRWDNPRSTPRR
jgi:hypothetical protein